MPKKKTISEILAENPEVDYHTMNSHAGSPNINTMTPEEYLAYMPEGTTIEEATTALQNAQQYQAQGGGAPVATPTVDEQIAAMPTAPTPQAPELGSPPTVTTPPVLEAPTVPEMPAVTPPPAIGAPSVTPAPEYKPTAEEQTWAGMYSGEIKDILEAGGRGLDEETKRLMIRQQTQMLTAREDENLRIMHNDMERRGITNSGLVFWNQQKIKSATTTAIANSITDIQIKSALMKISSFENALGRAGQFLGYLQEQSKMVYAGKMATWEARTQASLIQYQAKVSADLAHWKMENQYNLTNWQVNTQALFTQWEANSNLAVQNWQMQNQFNMAEWETQANYDLAVFQIQTQAQMANWSAQMDIYKLSIAQAYEQDNMMLLSQINAQSAAQQQLNDIELLNIKLEAEQKQADSQGFWGFLGSLFGWIFM